MNNSIQTQSPKTETRNAIHGRWLVRAVFCLLLSAFCFSATAQTSAFTYQGRLDAGGTPHTGLAEIQFSLWNAASGGSQLGSTLTLTPVGVTNGLFTVTLDFGNQFPGANRWLEIAVRTNLLGFTTLAPRQPITATPYAVTAGNLTGTLPAGQLSGPLPSANLGGTYSGVVTLDNAANSFTGNGAGLTSLNASQLTIGTVPDARLAANVARTHQVWLLGGNAGTSPATHFLGTTDDQPLEFRVNGVRGLRLEPTTNDVWRSGIVNVVGGSPANRVAAGVAGATIAGGGAVIYFGGSRTNLVAADFGTVGGGMGNTIQTSASSSTIGGGGGNTIQTSAFYSTIGGGEDNTIQTYAYNSTIGGGRFNTIQPSAFYSTIGGGWANTIQSNAAYATVPGGHLNSATNYAFAAGRRAKANHTGTFVWADSTDTDFASTGTNQFLIRASGGMGINTTTPQAPLHVWGRAIVNGADQWDVNNTEGDFRVGSATHRFKIGVAQGGGGAGDVWMRAHGGTARLFLKTPGGTTIYSNEAQTNGVTLAAGGGSWTSVSDRHAKENFAPVDPQEVLEKVAALPLASWNYKSQDASIRHLGPMAQDFKAAFGLGESDTGITTVDADGVALAAIQGLNAKVESGKTELAELRAENAALKARLEKLEQLLTQPLNRNGQ